MRLPTLVIASFRRSCQSDIDDINDLLAEHDHADLVAEVGLAQRLGRLLTALWKQWRCMDTAWCNHNPKDGNVGVEALARLGKIVEATGVAVDSVLRLSGRILEEERGVACPESTLPFPDVTRGGQQRECIQRYADNVAAVPGGDVEAVVAVRTGDGEKSIVVNEAPGEAAMTTKKAGVDAIGGATGLLAQDVTQVVDEEVEAEDPALAKTVGSPAHESIEVLHEVEHFGTQTITWWDGGEFHEVEMPALVSGVAARCERVNLEVRRREDVLGPDWQGPGAVYEEALGCV